MNNTSIYTKEELIELAIIKKARFDIIEDMTKDGPPSRGGDIRVLNEVLTSADKMIVDTANTRLKQEDSANSGVLADMVVELLKQARYKKSVCAEETDITNMPSEVTQIETVDGETTLDPERLDPENFVTPSFDANEIK